MLGRPNCGEPVFTNSLAGPWLKTSVAMLLTMQTSSTIGRQVRQQLAQLGAALAVPRELAARAQQLGVALDEGEPLALDERLRERLAVELLQLRLVVEQLELAGPAGHEQVDDALGLGREMRRPRARADLADRADRSPRRASSASSDASAIEPSPTPQLAEEMAARGQRAIALIVRGAIRRRT